MRLARNFVASTFYRFGYATGTFFITISNAFEAGFQAAERRYAKFP